MEFILDYQPPRRTYRRKKPVLPGYFDEAEEAELLGVSLSTLRRWKRRKIGPVPITVGRSTLYSIDENERWLAEQQAKALDLSPAPVRQYRPHRRRSS
jgi:DNA-binding transcriptional MerR regulator